MARRLAGRLLLGAAIALGIAAAAQAAEGGTPKKDLVLRGDAKCTRCHDAGDDYPVLAIGQTRHGTTADGRTPTCTSCHGESQAHLDNPGGKADRPKPDRAFGKRSATPIEARNEACLACHQGGKRIHWDRSPHAAGEVACSTCHKVHTAHDDVRDKLTQADVCFTCHKEQRAQLRRPSRHPILEGKVACSDCHNPHGTTNPNLLKVRPPFLCQSCHQPSSHHATVPLDGAAAGAPTLNQGVIMARGCVNCHTNIHGSNNASDPGTGRGFRR